jgi:type II secretory pathway pseudopilin PulG
MRFNFLHREDGFTLAELLVMTSVMLILMAGIGGMIESGSKSSTAAHSFVLMEGDSNEALNTMTRQIRVASHIDPDSDASELGFTGDLSGDGTPRAQAFMVEDGSLVKDGQPWIEGVVAVTFTYHYYNREIKDDDVLIPGSFPGWNEQVERVEIKLEMSRTSMGIAINRTYYANVTLMNALY